MGRRRTLIPHAFSDLGTWPCPDLTVLDDETGKLFRRRRKAIEMYHGDECFDTILFETGLHRPEIKRLISRCLTLDGDGQLYGWHALIKAFRVKAYVRTAKIEHARGSGSGGCSGALDQLFDRFPEVRELVETTFFGIVPKGEASCSRIGVSQLHKVFLDELRRLNFSDDDWPFCTENCGYMAITRFCKKLVTYERDRAVLPRFGREAANRNGVGNGHTTLFKPLRPYTFAQFDFNKVVAASCFTLENDYGTEFEVLLPRWHFGLMIEELSGACLGYCVALEITPSGDSVLEAMHNALTASESSCELRAPALICELLPEMRHQCFSALKVDNAWSNASSDVVNNIMDVVGAAVNFGPVRSWWRRGLIERIFGRLEEMGLKRLSSTYGSGPADTRVTDAGANAAKFKISVAELERIFVQCIREHNTERSERNQHTSPVARLRHALSTPGCGLFTTPLPQFSDAGPLLLMHREVVTVRGDIKKNIRPFFILGKHRHTNPELANAFWLIGKKLVASANRRLAREVRATVLDTGQDLGMMQVAGPWANSECSWRNRVLLQRSGQSAKMRRSADDPLTTEKDIARSKLKGEPKRTRKKGSRDALMLVRLEREEQRAAIANASTPTQLRPISIEQTCRKHEAQAGVVPKRNDPLGLLRLPEHSPVRSDE